MTDMTKTATMPITLDRCFLSLIMLLVPWVAQAQAEKDSWSYKLTPTYYSNSNQHAAWDVNLRGQSGTHTVWIGQYMQGQDANTEKFQQTRMGYENAMPMPFGVLVPSLQLATGGFAGGSLTAQIGSSDAYALLGLGRTNVHTYYNLNFDPNDAITVGYAQRLPDQSMVTAYFVWDDRLATSQKVAHLVWRKQLNATQRLTLDLAVKNGRPEAGQALVNGHIVSIGLDQGEMFFKLAVDRKVNFSDTNQVRTVVGLRF